MDNESSESGIVSESHRGYVVLAEGTIASDYALRSLNKALGEAQIEFTPAVKGEVNTHVGYKYTPLAAIIGAVRPSLAKNHLTVSQFSETDLERKTVTVHSRIVHWDSGEWMQNSLELPAELSLGKGGNPVFNQQTIGGSQTYAQKYAYKSILGIPDSEEMIDSTEDKGDLPSRQKRQDDVREAALQRARQMQQDTTSAISHQAPPVTTQQSSHLAHQRANTAPQAAQPQAGQCKFIPPNGLTCVVKGVRQVEAQEPTTERPKGVRGYVAVNFLGQHNGVSVASCFDTKFWELLKDSVGLECHFLIKEADRGSQHYINIEDVLWIDGQEYVDGKPVSQEG